MKLPSLTIAALLLGIPAAQANTRSFAYTYESATLPRGERELEIQNTARLGRAHGSYRAYDQRLELEGGLTDRLQGSLYLNAETEHTDAGTASVLDGLSLELKYRVLDAGADAVGLAGYLELTSGPDEAEVEAKLIVDQIELGGDLRLAANLVYEGGVEDPGGDSELEHELGLELAGSWALGGALSLGAEVRAEAVVGDEAFGGVRLNAGPNLALRSDALWAVLTVLPQMGVLGGDHGFDRDLAESERLEARLIVGGSL